MADEIRVHREGEAPNCPVCRKKLHETFTQACFFFNEDLEKVIEGCTKKERQKHIYRFLVLVNSLLNQGGGVIHVHTKPHLLGFWDEQIDEELMQLVPDDTLFHENYERHVREDDHVTFRVKPRCRPASTLDFHSKVSLNKGLTDPTHSQMRRLMSVDFSPPLDTDTEASTFTLPQNSLQKGQEVQICESVNVQAKVVLEKKIQELQRRNRGKSRAEVLTSYWCDDLKLPSYVTAFTKIPRGGSFFLGLKEQKVQAGSKWIRVPGLDKFYSLFGGDDGKLFWKDDKNDNILHLATEDDVPKREHTKSGRFVCEGVELSTNEKEEMKQDLMRRVKEYFLLQPATQNFLNRNIINQLVQLHFHPVSSAEANNNEGGYEHGAVGGHQPAQGAWGGQDARRLYVVEARVQYFLGVCFRAPSGKDLTDRRGLDKGL